MTQASPKGAMLSDGKFPERNKGIAEAKRERKRIDAQIRQAEHSKRTPEQQRALIAERRGNSTKEIARIDAQV